MKIVSTINEVREQVKEWKKEGNLKRASTVDLKLLLLSAIFFIPPV